MNRAIAVVIILFITSNLISCKNRISEEKKKAISERTVQNLVFVEGGTFMMGDAGAEFTDENGKKFFSYWTADRDTKPAHKVILDSYSIMKYEVTYKEGTIRERKAHGIPGPPAPIPQIRLSAQRKSVSKRGIPGKQAMDNSRNA